ncbi:LysM peptidoglycan-binding domain-containing protein [Shewanella intestini]|uniref:LysM peptidoglycan-binding domain-containing protein n=1 Tax=Shewanella intestini TaxID=2017544 RepID=A0ABS5I476_9GAMM|nr:MULTISPECIES: LysM peptidoglycan-binding domain-containing protein [Shewanella]MBR9728839.1 LysM peptidoglycan-binding domain-containing protein [Shewanella intestini]MRG37095.1 LysM peptidoglycan-binding domain-containing protein [Shewanella sp. XMDDZSB0408]
MDLCMRRLLILAFLALNITQVNADTLTLKAGHPDTYVVKKGDTLWDISGYFLKDPWRWPTLWGHNPQIANPHLIYPGDRLTLVFIDGKPRLVVKQHLVKSVEGRIKPKNGAIPAVDLSLIHQYLNQNRVVDEQWLDGLPIVLSGESPSRHHIIDDIVYVNAKLPSGQKVLIYQPAREFTNKDSGEVLGREIIVSASGRVVDSGDISKVQLLSNLRETRVGFKVAPVDDDSLMPAYFVPQAAQTEGASVLATVGNIREVGKLDVVYLDKGSEDGVRPGNVFSIYRDGEEIIIGNDGVPVRVIDRTSYEKVLAYFSEDNVTKMPDIFHGKLMVFKVFDKTSMGLIMHSDRPVRVGDKLMIPEKLTLKGQ